ncbi:Peroxisomal NADH pyrophosphatase nudt12 [Rhizophlyctis rosea]|nr:Peroxisomal NADH pyrophosphatase nudt12 [Rhizophlyctis rosea]
MSETIVKKLICILKAGYKRYCTKEDCRAHKGVQNFSYPRTDPVIIVCITNQTNDKILLGRQKSWPAGMYSCIAGFIESGESLEEAVRREAWEETNVRVGKVAYHSSQPWPFPSQLMFGCMAQAVSEDIKLEDKELDDARWWTRDEVRAALKAGVGHQNLDPPEGKDGTKLWLPPAYAIANTIMKAWAVENFEFKAERPEEAPGGAKM